MEPVREAAVAGRFYPDDPDTLRAMVRGFLEAAPQVYAGTTEPSPKALIAPHAGYIYSGIVAASAYARLRPEERRIGRVVMLGPAHRMKVRGLAASGATGFATPLGTVLVDQEAVGEIADLPQVQLVEEAHRFEHCLEVQLPFLQETVGEFKLVPLLVGDASVAEVVDVLERLWGQEETLIVISSDLSHYHDYETAVRIDAATSQSITALREQMLQPETACGCTAIKALIDIARRRGIEAAEVDLRNSGDTAGPKDQVVGYGSYAFF